MCTTPPFPIDGTLLPVSVAMIAMDRAEFAATPSGTPRFQYRSDRTPTISRLQYAVAPFEPLDFEGYLRVLSGVRLLRTFFAIFHL